MCDGLLRDKRPRKQRQRQMQRHRQKHLQGLAPAEDHQDTRIARFFRIASRLHQDLQLVLANRVSGSAALMLPLEDRELGFAELARTYA